MLSSSIAKALKPQSSVCGTGLELSEEKGKNKTLGCVLCGCWVLRLFHFTDLLLLINTIR